MLRDSGPAIFLRNIRSRDLRVGTRLGASLITGLLCTSLACVVSWCLGQLRQSYVHDTDVAWGFCSSALLWLWSLYKIWRPAHAARKLLMPILFTPGIALVTIVLIVVADEYFRRNEEFLMMAAFLSGAAALIGVWSFALVRLNRGRPVIGHDEQVDVHCPNCGYSLIGLTELRCPECGERFTIDTLIRAQDYRMHDGTRVDLDPKQILHTDRNLETANHP